MMLPVLRTTAFDDARRIFGQELLEEYNKWTIEHSGSRFYLDRMKYFNTNSKEFNEFLETHIKNKEENK